MKTLVRDREIIDVLNRELSGVANAEIQIQHVRDTEVKYSDCYGLHLMDILSPMPYFQHVLLDSRDASPRGELWKIYNGFFRFLGIFRNWDYAQRNFGHGMHFDESHDYFQGLCFEYFCGHTEQAFIHSSQGLLKRYRDHAAHMCRVGALGAIILNSELGEHRSIDYYLQHNGFSNEDLRIIWWTLSLLHDIGYLWEELLRLLEDGEEDKPYLMQVRRYILADEFLHYVFYGEYAPGLFLDDKRFIELNRRLFSNLKKELKLNGRSWIHHEVIGPCLLYLHQKDYGIPTSAKYSKTKKNILSEAVRIMGQHHFTDNNASVIDFDIDPLGFLLIFCDESQEWGRPIRTKYEVWACELTEIQLIAERNLLRVILHYPDPNILEICNFSKSKFHEDKQKALARLKAPFSFEIEEQFG